MEMSKQPDETDDKLLGAIDYLYSTQDRRSIQHDYKKVPWVYQQLFANHGVPLTDKNLDLFMHDVGVAVMEVSWKGDSLASGPLYLQPLPLGWREEPLAGAEEWSGLLMI